MDEQVSRFLKTQYAQQLLADAGALEADLREFNDAWRQFWERSADDLGKFLICHLAVEHYLDDWLAAANPGTKPVGETRLTFAHKLSLIDGADAFTQWMLPALKKFNRIRNQLSHEMEAQISDDDLQPIKNIVWPWNEASKKPCREGIELVCDFALMAAGFLSSQANAIRRHGKGDGLVAYQKWVDAAMSEG